MAPKSEIPADAPSVRTAEFVVIFLNWPAALLLEERIGEQFDASVTGASDKGAWAGPLDILVEGLVVGDQVRVQLTSINVERGFIDFKKVGSSRR